MWISKKKWEEIQHRINKNESDINMINQITRTIISIHNEHVEKCSKPNKVDTNTIKNITLEELACYVIDGTPIERDKTVKVKYYKGE